MKTILALTCFCLITMLGYGQTQYELNQIAYKGYLKAEKQLNNNYQAILKAYKSDTVFIRNFKKAQKIWYQLRDAEMDAYYPERADELQGISAPMCWNLYKTDLTKTRIKKLRMWLVGVEEGDKCRGTPKAKKAKLYTNEK